MSTSTILKPKKRNIFNPLNAWRVFSQKGLNTGISSQPPIGIAESMGILGSQSTDPEQLKKDFGCCCGGARCCLIGSGRTWLVERTGSTCWMGDNNWLVYRCISGTDGGSSFTIVGAGIIGYGDLRPNILKLTYEGTAIGDEYDEENEEYQCPTTTYVRLSRQDSVSLQVVGTRTSNGKAALGFGKIEGNPDVGTTCGEDKDIKMYYPAGFERFRRDTDPPGPLGGQGNWSLTIDNVDPDGDYILQLTVSCYASTPQSFPTAFVNPVGKFFYIVGDNQGIGSEMNLGGNTVEVFQCGEQMIEGRIYNNNGEVEILKQPDCIVRYIYGYITDYIPEEHEGLVNWPQFNDRKTPPLPSVI